MPANSQGLDVVALNNPIPRGATQHLQITVFNDDGPLGGAGIAGKVLYAGDHVENFNGITNIDGLYEYEWQIGGNSNPGMFRVKVVATFDGQRAETLSTFTVTGS